MAELRVNGEIDRESVSEFALTIKCFKRKTKAFSLQKTYNKQDPSERQVVIKVLDVDDNLPKFVHENVTLGELSLFTRQTDSRLRNTKTKCRKIVLSSKA